MRAALDEPIQPTDRADHERFVAAAQSRLDQASFAAAWAAGARLTLQEAIELALARLEPARQALPSGAGAAGAT